MLKHSLRVLLLGNQVSSADSTTVTLIPFFTKESLHKEWGSPRPPHKVVVTAPPQVGGSMTYQRATNAPRGRRTEIQVWFTLEPKYKATTRCSLTHLGANLTETLTKLVLRTKDLITKLLNGLEMFLGVCVVSWNSSKLQMTGGTHIYSLQT